MNMRPFRWTLMAALAGLALACSSGGKLTGKPAIGVDVQPDVPKVESDAGADHFSGFDVSEEEDWADPFDSRHSGCPDNNLCHLFTLFFLYLCRSSFY